MAERTMAEALRVDRLDENGRARFVVYEPGNMTRYEVFFQKIDSVLSKEMGFGSGATLVVFANMPNRPSLLLPDHTGYLSLDYFLEKTGMNEGDAIPLLRLVKHKLNLEGS